MMDFSGMKELTIGGVKLRELSVDGVKVWQAGRLPAGYTEVEWIETDGASWIDTGVNASLYPDGIRYALDVYTIRFLSTTSTNYYFGAYDGTTRAGALSYAYSSGEFWLLVGKGAVVSRKCKFEPIGKRIFIEAFSTSTADTATLTIDGQASTRGTTITTANMPNANVYLGHSSGISTTSSTKPLVGRIYSFTMAKADGTPIRDFVPAKYRDGTVGMFDLVTNTFFGNAGTGTLTAGGAV